MHYALGALFWVLILVLIISCWPRKGKPGD